MRYCYLPTQTLPDTMDTALNTAQDGDMFVVSTGEVCEMAKLAYQARAITKRGTPLVLFCSYAEYLRLGQQAGWELPEGEWKEEQE